MKIGLLSVPGMAVAILGFAQSAFADVPAALGDDAAASRDHGYVLAYREAGSITRVQDLLVKGERDEIRDVTRDVAKLATQFVEALERFAQSQQPSIHLDRNGLLPIDVAAHDRIQKAARRDLIHATGCDFEKRLLFTEGMATARLLALSEEMAANAGDEAEHELWRGLLEQVAPVHERIVSLYTRDCQTL